MSDDADYPLKEAWELFRSGDHYESLDRLFAVAQEHPDDHNLVLFIGDVYLEAGDYGQAKRYYERARDMRPDDAAPYNALGRLYDRMTRRAEAIPFWQAASDRSAGYQGEKARGMLAMVAQRFGEAAQHFLEARRLLREEEEVPPGGESEKDAWLGFIIGYNLMENRQFAEAKPYMEHASKWSAWAYFCLGAINSRLRRYDEAIAVFERIWEGFPARYRYAAGLNLVKLYFRRGNFKKAWRYLLDASALPGDKSISPHGGRGG